MEFRRHEVRRPMDAGRRLAGLGDDHGDAPGHRIDLDALGALASEARGLERASAD